MISYLNRHLDALAADHTRGAAEIVNDALSLFDDVAKEALADPSGGESVFNRAVRRLATGQPSMAPVLNLINAVCQFKTESGPDWEVFRTRLGGWREAFLEREEAILRRVDDAPMVGSTVATFSNSSTVASMIIACHKRFGWPQLVLCGEGRPMLEGLIMARRLKSEGVSATLYTDAALMSRVEIADVVWVGGDSLSREGLVNKVGSRALAILALMGSKPFMSFLTSDKLLAPGLMEYFRYAPHNPREIAADEADGLDIVNEYYENVPLELVTGVITEDGLRFPSALVDEMDDQPACELMRRLVDG